MIAALTGKLACKSPSQITLDVQGVGYELFIPLSTFYSLPDIHQSVSLRVHTHLREDALQLFGFLTAREKDAFILLTGISGIGPKLALSVLSTLSVTDLASAIQSGDIGKLSTVPGIGKKSAERMVLELKDKVARLQSVSASVAPAIDGLSSQVHEDALSALVNLGYRAQEAKDIIKRITQSQSDPIPLKDLIRETLKELARG